MPLLSHRTSCTPAESNLHLANSLTTAVREPDLYRLLTFQLPHLMPLFHCLGRTKVSAQFRGTGLFLEYASFYGETFSARRPTAKLEDHPLLSVRYCLFNIFAATLHIGGRSSMILTVSRDLFRKQRCYTGDLCNGDGLCSLRGKNGIFVWYLHELRCSITIFV